MTQENQFTSPNPPAEGPPSDVDDWAVLFLDNSFTFGGAIHSLKHLVAGLSEKGIQSVVVSGQAQEWLREVFPGASTISTEVRVPWIHPTMLVRLLHDTSDDHQIMGRRIIGLLAALDWHLRRTLPAAIRYAFIGARHNVDIVHLNNNLESQLAGLVAAKLLRVPCVAHAQGFQKPSRLLHLAARNVDSHIALSHAIARNLKEIGAPKDRISIVPHGVDLSEFHKPAREPRIRSEFGIPSAAQIFGFFGRIVEWKGVEEFLRAGILVMEQVDSAWALIIGDESDSQRNYFDKVRQAADESDVADRIVFTGYRDDVPLLMHSCDIIVHTSVEAEPFGLVIAEAMAAGKPVVAANCGGPVDIVEHGETGLLVDPRDSEALASAIHRLLLDPDLAESMGEAGRRRAARLFSKERYTDQVLEIYRELGY